MSKSHSTARRPPTRTSAAVEALARDARGGDLRARDELVALYLPLVYNIVGRALDGHHDVDDVVQNTMLQVVRGLPGLRAPDRFRSWVVAIAYREIQQHLRRRPAVPLPVPDDTLDTVPGTSDVAERTVAAVVADGQYGELSRACRWLEPEDRTLMALWWQEASGTLTRAELAACLSVSTAHAAMRVRRLRQRLDTTRAVVRALEESPRCGALEGVLDGWTGEPAPVWRKRISRHLRTCADCRRHGEGLVAPERLLLGGALAPVPFALAEAVRSALHGTAVAAQPAHWLGQGSGLLMHRAALKTAASVAGGGLAAGSLVWAVHVAPAPGTATPGRSASVPAASARTSVPPPEAKATGTAASPPSGTASPPRATAGYGVTSADLFVAPTGSDDADGTRHHPLGSLAAAVSRARPGDVIAVRGGVYRPAEPVEITVSGTAKARITLANYAGEKPVFDLAGVPDGTWGVTHRGAYWTVRGLEFMRSTSHAYVCLSCRHDVFSGLTMHDNARSGLTLRGPGTLHNTVTDSDFHDNHDSGPDSGAGIGLGVKFGSGEGNVVRRCRSYHNADDGFDFGEFTSALTVEDNWSYGNGVDRWNKPGWEGGADGFTFGGGDTPAPVAHVVTDNAAWENEGAGFTDEGNTGRLTLRHNTAYRNGTTGFSLRSAAASLSDNVAADNGADTALGPAVEDDGNLWGGGTAGDRGLFLSTDPATAEAARPEDRALPATRFLRTRSGKGADMDG